MKRIFFAALSAMMLVACGAPTEKITITEQGVGPIVLGATADAFPATFEGLYDEIVVEHIDAYFDDWMGEDMPASDNYTFKRGGVDVATLTINEGETVREISIVDPELDYKGVRVGSTLAEAVAAGAQMFAGGMYGSCEFYCEFKIDKVIFKLNNIFNADVPYEELDFGAFHQLDWGIEKYDAEAKVESIVVNNYEW